MSFYWSPAIESRPVATTMFIVLFCSVWKLEMANPKTHDERPWHQFDQADVRESPRPLHNIQSQKPKPSTSPAPLSIVTLSASGLYGISKPKGALDSKVAVTSIQPSQRPAVAPSRTQYVVPRAQTKHKLCPFVYCCVICHGVVNNGQLQGSLRF